jgi:hypothetical protein
MRCSIERRWAFSSGSGRQAHRTDLPVARVETNFGVRSLHHLTPARAKGPSRSLAHSVVGFPIGGSYGCTRDDRHRAKTTLRRTPLFRPVQGAGRPIGCSLLERDGSAARSRLGRRHCVRGIGRVPSPSVQHRGRHHRRRRVGGGRRRRRFDDFRRAARSRPPPVRTSPATG